MERPQNKNLRRGGPGRPRGVPNKATAEMQEIARGLTTGNPLWLAGLKLRLEEGKEAPAVVVTLLHYAHGKPKETIEHKGLTGVAQILVAALDKAADGE